MKVISPNGNIERDVDARTARMFVRQGWRPADVEAEPEVEDTDVADPAYRFFRTYPTDKS